jgi:TctA family transporter
MQLQLFALSIPRGLEWLLLIVVAILLFFWIRAILEIARSSMSAKNKIWWLLLVIFTGLIGLIIYSVWRIANRQHDKSVEKIQI